MNKTTAATTVFLSYGRDDDHADYYDPAKSFIRRLYNDLTDAGYDVWWDREKMPSRALTFLQEIQDAITPCRLLILVVGEHALQSDYVRAEWEFALQHCIPVVPILRSGDYTSIPATVSNFHAPDFRVDKHYDSALAELKRILSEPDAPLGTLYGVPLLPPSYIQREVMGTVREKLLVDTEKPLVITARQQTFALHGLGGIGKTTLVAALSRACDVRHVFRDGIFWLEMGKNADVVTRMGDIGVAFGDSRDEYPDVSRARSRLSALLTGKRVLIVLDDVWNHQHAEAFRVVDSGCRLLLTTRLGGIATKLDAQGQPLDVLTEAEGRALFAERLHSRPEDLSDECSAIVRIVGGHTLAVSLAAAQLAEHGADYSPRLLKRLQEGKFFKALKLDDDDKNLNLELCLFLSYDDLSADLQRRFRALGVFPLEGAFDEDAAQAVWADEDVDDSHESLEVLARAGLLQRAPDNYYTQHGLLRAYARALLDAENETETIFNRYADFVIAQAEQFWNLPPQDWSQLDALLPHVDYVGAELVRLWEATENPDDALNQHAEDFADKVVRYVERRPQAMTTANGTVLRGLDWLEMGLVASRQNGNQRRESLFLNQIAMAWSALGEQRKALDYFEQALPLDQTMGDRNGEATTLNNIGRVWSALGEKNKALDYYEQSLPLRRVVGNRGGEATTLNNIGSIWWSLGDQEKALAYYEQALQLYRAVGDRRGEAATLNNIGTVWDKLGENHKAMDYYEQALPLCQAVGDRDGEASTLNNIGGVWQHLGENQKALDYFEQALPLQRAVSDRDGEAVTLFNMSFLVDNTTKALQLVQEAYDLWMAIESPNAHQHAAPRLAQLRGGSI